MSNRAIVLAGGLGTRMGELTRCSNKHLLPVGNQPMIYYPIQFLIQNGFTEILIVVGQKGCGEILRQLGDGTRFGAKFLYAFQEGEGGIAAALQLGEPFLKHDFAFAVALGDNIFPETLDLRAALLHYDHANWGKGMVFCTKHKNPELFGCALLNKEKLLVEQVVEKPQHMRTGDNIAVVTGLYIYTPHVFRILKDLKPSQRGELEISTINDYYATLGRLHYRMIEGEWIDCGTPELYREAQTWAEQKTSVCR